MNLSSSNEVTRIAVDHGTFQIKTVDSNNALVNITTGTISDSTVGVIQTTGWIEASTFTATSDRRLKENIKPYTSNKSILNLPIYEFNYKRSGIHTIGCMAQDLKEICPEIVREGSDGYLTIQESKILYLLLQEVKQLKEQIIKLER